MNWTTFTFNNITSKRDITLNNIITSSWVDITSTAGKISVSTWTTHTYNNLSSYWNITITSISDYKANNISSNAKLIVSGSTIEITNTTDMSDESKPNIDIALGSDFIITNSVANLYRSSIQTNWWLQIDNTLWKSQNLNVNWYQIISWEKVWIYFKWWRDRYIYWNIFAWWGDIWIGSSSTPDNWNILLFRNAQISTNWWIKVYRSNTTYTDRFAFAPDETITENLSILSQLYNWALASNSWSIIGSGTWTNVGYIID